MPQLNAQLLIKAMCYIQTVANNRKEDNMA